MLTPERAVTRTIHLGVSPHLPSDKEIYLLWDDAKFGAVVPQQVNVKALVRWATGERLTYRLPKLSLITLSPPLNRGILGLRMGPYVPTPMFFYNLWGRRESDSSDS